MPVDLYWEWTRMELKSSNIRNSSFERIPDDEFQPGDFAYHEESIHTVFMEFLERKQYRLTTEEDVESPKKGRYCIVLQRISQDKYIICYCATFGGARGFQDLTDPVARHFGVPLNENTIWPSVKPLRTSPAWKSTSGAFVLAIPVIRDGLRRSNIGFRIRLYFQDLLRLKGLVKDRSQSFDRYANVIRAGHRDSKYAGKPLRGPIEISLPPESIRLNKVANLAKYHKQLKPSSGRQDLFWLLEQWKHSRFSRSIYLETLPLRKRPLLLGNLPKPFFASSLRASLKSIARLILR